MLSLYELQTNYKCIITKQFFESFGETMSEMKFSEKKSGTKGKLHSLEYMACWLRMQIVKAIVISKHLHIAIAFLMVPP